MELSQWEAIEDRLRVPVTRLRVVIDSDTKNEVDDQFAIAWALRSPERFAIEAVYAAPFDHARLFSRLHADDASKKEAASLNGHSRDAADGMEQSYQEILTLFDLLEEDPAGRVFRGSPGFFAARNAPLNSDAAVDLVDRAMGGVGTLYVIAIGALTNIASALLMEPRIAERIVVVWLGGQPGWFGHGIELNLAEDVIAAQTVFDAGVPLIRIPCMNVASLLSVSEAELREKLLGKSRIGTYLAQICLDSFGSEDAAYAMLRMNRAGYLKGRDDQDEADLALFQHGPIAWSRIIWDISAVAALKNPAWTPSMLEPSPILLDDCTWGAPDMSRHPVRTVTYCHRDEIFGDLFACLNAR